MVSDAPETHPAGSRRPAHNPHPVTLACLLSRQGNSRKTRGLTQIRLDLPRGETPEVVTDSHRAVT